MAKKEDSLVKPEAGGLVKPDFLPAKDKRGTESITTKDIQLPRLVLAQGPSPQLVPGEPQYIKGLTIGDAFNTLTGEIYGKGPFEFTVIRVERTRAVEFSDRKEGGGVKDPNVPLDDPRCQFIDGKKPIATKFMEYIVMMLPSQQLVLMSFKSKGIRRAQAFNSLILGREQASFACKFTAESVMDKNSSGTWATWRLNNSAVQDECTSNPGFTSKAIYDKCESIWKQMEGKEVATPTDSSDMVDEAPDKEVPY